MHLLSREALTARAVEGAPNLKSRVRREMDGRVQVNVSAAPSAELRRAITSAGGTIFYESTRWNIVSASLPPRALQSLAGRADVRYVTPIVPRTAHGARVINQADPAHRADFARATYGVNGSGINVGVISDSSRHSSNSIFKGELPGNFTVLPDRDGIGSNDTGEGTAMSEIVHDIAPGARIFFASAGINKFAMADSILMLRSNGCQVIVDDISFSDEWQFQDDAIGQAVNEVVAGGAVYLSSAGNEGNLKQGNSTTWEGDFVDGGAPTGALAGTNGSVHSFGPLTYNRLTGEGNSSASLQWSDPYFNPTNDYDLYILSADGATVVTVSNNEQPGGQPPFEYVAEVRPGERIVILKNSGAAARYLRLSTTGSKLEFQTAGQTIGHAGTPNCITVAASDASVAVGDPDGFFTTNSILEMSSSDGPHKMFFNPNGEPLTPGNFLASGGTNVQTPAITGGDGGATSVPGFMPFYGTSAAAPACAAIAALVWSRNPSLTGPQIRNILETSCLDIADPGFDINSGNGILRADFAVAKAVTVNPLPASIAFSLTTTNVILSWPLDRLGWRLLMQTNQLARGVRY